MNHEQAVPMVSDWARGALDGERAAEVERHVLECPECLAAAEGARALLAESERAAPAARAHPAAQALAGFVTNPDSQPVQELAIVGLHLRTCEPCREDVELMREASAPGWWRGARAWVASAPEWSRTLQPALALAVIVLLFPAWNGLVVGPRERAEAERRLGAAEEARARAESEARERAASPSAPRGGGASVLVLRGTVRSGASLPTLRVHAGQELQPLLIDIEPHAGLLEIRLRRADGEVAWSSSGPREEFWDEENRLVGVLVPAAVLSPGEYRLELASGPARDAYFASAFRVLGVR